jgi:hypothetical protein
MDPHNWYITSTNRANGGVAPVKPDTWRWVGELG